MKKYHLVLILLTAVVCATAKASSLFISLDSPVQSGAPGAFLQFFGTITNTTGSTVDLSSASDNFTLTGFNYFTDVTDLFFANVPLSLAAGASTGDIELFDITIPNPYTDSCALSADCGGTYQILDGSGNVLGTAFFTVDVQPPSGVPEPSPAVLLSSALLLLMVARKIITRPVG
jgi:hypothetical protein